MVPAVAILKNLDKRPSCYLADDGTWPDGPLKSDAPPEAQVALHIAAVLRDYCAARRLSTYKAAKAAGMSQGAFYNLLSGRAWPAGAVVARIEQNLSVALWPQLHNTELGLCPKSHLAVGKWPHGRFRRGAPPEAQIAQTASQRFGDEFDRFDNNVASAARQLQVSEGAIEALLNGTAWLDVPTITRIENNLDVGIWD